VIRDVMDPARADALAVTLGRAERFAKGDPLPPFFHQVYFWDPVPADGLGRDGHPRTGTGLIPDMGLPRRMWAGGRLTFVAPLRAGVPAEKHATVVSTQRKLGRTGPLAFVTLRHDIVQAHALCVREFQDLVYREDPDPDAPARTPRQAPGDVNAEDVRFDSTLLFRYSALTFNGHRIHYDLDYAREVEGYPGLVTHGPLLAQLLMLKAARALGPLTAFSFRAVAPLGHTETATLCRDGQRLWARGPGGGLAMEADAEVGP
jgi:3-methylfumaryl-CoA hydratase